MFVFILSVVLWWDVISSCWSDISSLSQSPCSCFSSFDMMLLLSLECGISHAACNRFLLPPIDIHIRNHTVYVELPLAHCSLLSPDGAVLYGATSPDFRSTCEPAKPYAVWPICQSVQLLEAGNRSCGLTCRDNDWTCMHLWRWSVTCGLGLQINRS